MAQTKAGALKLAARATGASYEEFQRLTALGMKHCAGCKTWHSVSEFGADSKRGDGKAGTCRRFLNARVRENYVKKGIYHNATEWGSLPIDPSLPESASVFPARLRLKMGASAAEAQCGGLCLEWHGALTHKGYGKACYSGKLWLVHRLAILLYRSIDPKDQMVCHKCDNPKCCNPDHLFLGTAKDNVADMVAKGRQVRGDRVWVRQYPERLNRGQSNPASKLTDEQATAIIRRRLSGETQRSIAADLGIHHNHVGRIFRGERWSHLKEKRNGQNKR